MAAHSTQSKKRVPGPFSKDRVLTDSDKRTRVGRIIRTIRADLIEHCGGLPSAAERILIENAALKAARIHLFASRIVGEEDMQQGDSDKVLAWSNSLRLDLQALGLEKRLKDVTPSLADIIAASSLTKGVPA